MRKFFPAIALLLALGLAAPVLAGPLEEVLAIYNFNEKILDQINQEINEEERSVFFNKPRSVIDESSLLSSRPILLDSPATGSTLQPIIQPNPTQDLNGAGTALDAKKDPLSSKALFKDPLRIDPLAAADPLLTKDLRPSDGLELKGSRP